MAAKKKKTAKKKTATKKTASAGPARRTHIEVRGARVHNLKNIDLDIPRDQLVVVTGLSGSGKSSLAFDTVYAEGQRRYMESLSTYAKRFIAQAQKPDVDFMYGLSPVISIEQKTIGRNPRSTVGTMTDVASYLNLLFATASETTCPNCSVAIPIKTPAQVLDDILSLGLGAEVELRAPVSKIYGEDYEFLFTELRKQGYRHLYLDGKPFDISDDTDLDAADDHDMEVLIDTLVVGDDNHKEIATAIDNAITVGDPYVRVEVRRAKPRAKAAAFHKRFGCPKHRIAVARLQPEFFQFNDPKSACRTCSGLGTYMKVHTDLLVPDPRRSLVGGCFIREAFRYNPDNWDGRMVYSMSRHFGFDLDTPWKDLPKKIREMILRGTGTAKFELKLPPKSKFVKKPELMGGWKRNLGKPVSYWGIASRIERWYKSYQQRQESSAGIEAWLRKVMVEHDCPDCGGARLRNNRQQFKVAGKSIHEVGEINFAQLDKYLGSIKLRGKHKAASAQIAREIRGRVELLLGIGLDYLNFNRRSGTLSGGEAQRIRLSTQIGSGLMGMLYVLDEPSIGLHPKDNVKMIATLERLRDLGNSVLVVEHDEDTIRVADHVIEMGPGPGIHGGEVVVQGPLDKILRTKGSPTGAYLSGRESIPVPEARRPPGGKRLSIRGARHNNLKDVDVQIPLEVFVCITGASGSGKSSLLHDIVYKRLFNQLHDSRVLSGDHDAMDGIDAISKVVNIDQAPLGRNSRSNPATYIGFYDDIRTLFAETDEAKKRGFKPGRFSFNVKTGRCAECSGEGTIRTQLNFMPDVESRCDACRGQRFNPETLEVSYKDKTISDVLEMSIEDGAQFFADRPAIGDKIALLDRLGLGYLTLGQSATTLSGGEAQRVKLAAEHTRLKRADHTLYILDEPTTGLHLADIARLLSCLGELVDAGNTVVVIEHHLDVIKTADHVIDLGPEGGDSGGQVLATGTPEEIAKTKRSFTGQFLKPLL